jgi:hypothetical protein
MTCSWVLALYCRHRLRGRVRGIQEVFEFIDSVLAEQLSVVGGEDLAGNPLILVQDFGHLHQCRILRLSNFIDIFD